MLDARGQKIVAQGYLLSNIGTRSQGSCNSRSGKGWAAEADPCFRLLRQGVQLAGGMGELGDPDMMKRLLIAGQVRHHRVAPAAREGRVGRSHPQCC